MLKRILSICALGLVSVTAAHATTLSPGGSVAGSAITYDSSNLQLFTGGSFSYASGFANYSVAVYKDATNPFCSGCLDFVYLIDNESNLETFNSFSVSNFGGTNAVGYVTTGGAAPVTISALNGTITFNFTGIAPHTISDFLVIQTGYGSYAAGAASLTDTASLTQSGVGASPVPEPSTLVLLGSGFMGLAGAAKRKFLA